MLLLEEIVMRSIFKDEIDIVWDNYNYIINTLGFHKMIESTPQELQDLFTLNYKDLYFQVKKANEEKGRTKSEISYNILKLRRLITLWARNKIWGLDVNITFSCHDINNQFPKFGRQNPKITPSEKTIQRLQAKVLHQYIEDHNQRVDEILASRSYTNEKPRYITNLRDLRNCLMSECKIDKELANKLTKQYKNIVAHREVNDFSTQVGQDETFDDNIDII